MQTLIHGAPSAYPAREMGPAQSGELSSGFTPSDIGFLDANGISSEPMGPEARNGSSATDSLAAIGALMASQTLTVVQAETVATAKYLSPNEAASFHFGLRDIDTQAEISTLEAVGTKMLENENAFRAGMSGAKKMRIRGDMGGAVAFAQRQQQEAYRSLELARRKNKKVGEDEDEDEPKG